MFLRNCNHFEFATHGTFDDHCLVDGGDGMINECTLHSAIPNAEIATKIKKLPTQTNRIAGVRKERVGHLHPLCTSATYRLPESSNHWGPASPDNSEYHDPSARRLLSSDNDTTFSVKLHQLFLLRISIWKVAIVYYAILSFYLWLILVFAKQQTCRAIRYYDEALVGEQ